MTGNDLGFVLDNVVGLIEGDDPGFARVSGADGGFDFLTIAGYKGDVHAAVAVEVSVPGPVAFCVKPYAYKDRPIGGAGCSAKPGRTNRLFHPTFTSVQNRLASFTVWRPPVDRLLL